MKIGKLPNSLLNKIVLEADVIINIPKPKCHRLAGMTAALKNMVGVIYDKNSLPHRKIGSVEEGGDAYKKKNIFKHYMEVLDEKKTDSSLNKHYNIAQFYSFFEKVFFRNFHKRRDVHPPHVLSVLAPLAPLR